MQSNILRLEINDKKLVNSQETWEYVQPLKSRIPLNSSNIKYPFILKNEVANTFFEHCSMNHIYIRSLKA